jgi:hypothetical protein
MKDVLHKERRESGASTASDAITEIDQQELKDVKAALRAGIEAQPEFLPDGKINELKYMWVPDEKAGPSTNAELYVKRGRCCCYCY